MYVIIIGCGRVGGALAKVVAGEGHDVVVIDRDESRFRSMDPDFPGLQIHGDGMDVDVLRNAKIDSADVVVAATGDDNANLLCAQIARKLFNVPRAFVRIKDPKKMAVYEGYDVEAVSATSLAVSALSEMLKTTPEVRVIGTAAGGAVRLVSFELATWKACERLAKMVRRGEFAVAAIVKGDGAKLGYSEEALEPRATVVGAVSSERLKHLAGLFPRQRSEAA